MGKSAVTAGDLNAHLVVRRPDDFELDIELTIQTGTTVALLGPNGAGKSTAVAAIAGLLSLDRGHIALGGAVLDDPQADVFVAADERRVGVVFQDYLLFPHLPVVENIAFGLRSRRLGRVEVSRRTREWVHRLELEGLESHRPGDLSGGQAQRVALARALITEPDLLLLDEPLSALDVTTRSELRRRLAEHLAVFDGPRVLITHDPTEAFLLADQIHIVEEGIITQTGTADDIRLRPRTRYAADLAGSNLVLGNASDGKVQTGSHVIHIADTGVSGPVLVTISPTAIAVHKDHPEGSPRNVWATNVELVEHLGDRVRFRTGGPLPLTVEVTAGSASSLGLIRGSDVWLAVKATEIGVEPEG
ncbi:MAG: sulfate/molybdate ABC transporter ATP-binding protein [Acidimicrobiia bacterium]